MGRLTHDDDVGVSTLPILIAPLASPAHFPSVALVIIRPALVDLRGSDDVLKPFVRQKIAAVPPHTVIRYIIEGIVRIYRGFPL